MINATSPNLSDFDPQLLAVEEMFRQRHPERATAELGRLATDSYELGSLSAGLFQALSAEAAYHRGEYDKSVTLGIDALRILGPSALNRRVGRILWSLSRCYSALGALAEAELRARDSIAAYRRAEYRPGVVDGLNELARIAHIRSSNHSAAEFLEDALGLIDGDTAKEMQLKGNLGRLKIYTGHWIQADEMLQSAIQLNLKSGEETSAARNYISFGILRLRQRRFGEASQLFESAKTLIEKRQLVRERIIVSEFVGETLFERGDYLKAKSALTKAMSEAKQLAPESGLVTQIGRRLAETLLALDGEKDALAMAQATLERAEKLGELTEVALSHILIGRCLRRISPSSENAAKARDEYFRGIEILRQVGDPYDLGRALLYATEICDDQQTRKICELLKEAEKRFAGIDAEYYRALANLAYARVAFQAGDFAAGYAPLVSARAAFEASDDRANARQAIALMQSVSRGAVAYALSQANSFNTFRDFIGDADFRGIRLGNFRENLEIMRAKTGADRAMALTLGEGPAIFCAIPELVTQTDTSFSEGFRKLLDNEFACDKPTLILDASRDPVVNSLWPTNLKGAIGSVIAMPLRAGGELVGFVYLDKMTSGDPRHPHIAPFSQDALNFAVGFADIMALKMVHEQKRRLEDDNNRLKTQASEKVGFPSVITRSPEMIELLARIKQIMNADISVSLTGETGVGKDLLAKAIHYNSDRRDKRFVSVNCAALPETLLESELFGFRRGAFTGADRDKPGLFEEANGGTFFLDEIGDMPNTVQAKLLRVLEEKEVTRLGESQPRKVDVRIVSATHKDLLALIDAGLFREDLYYRLCALYFRIPALRERREDIPLLITRFSKPGYEFTPAAIRALTAYNWPGNIRELENEIKRACLISGDSRLIDLDLLSPKIVAALPVGSVASRVERPALRAIAPELALMSISDSGDFSLYDFIAENEKRFILKALAECAGVKKHAANRLRIPESTLRLKMKQYNLEAENTSAA